ncbi:MAG: hypothetical protein ACRERZ_06970 [Gammaproteobacteria bacterium]
MKLILIAGVTLLAAGITAGCGKSTSSQPAEVKQTPPALLVADPHWIPDPDVIALVKASTLDNCPRNTVEQQVNSYLGSPRWEAGADSTGRDFVNVSGIVTYQGKPAAAKFQFLIDKDKHGFKYHGFAINGVLQPGYVAAMTLREMCASASNAPINIIKIPHAATG